MSGTGLRGDDGAEQRGLADSALLEQALAGSGLPPSERPFLLRYGQAELYRAGRPLSWQDEEPERCRLVLSGRLGLSKQRLGALPLSLPAIGRGEWCCLAELVARSPVQADCSALEETRCLSFSAYNLASLRSRPALDSWLCLCLARQGVALLSFLAEGDSRSRLISWLLSRRRSVAGLESRSVTATQAQIAAQLGLTRETVNKRLSELEALGLIATGRGEIGVEDWASLEDALRDG